jgi:hypothetical protein
MISVPPGVRYPLRNLSKVKGEIFKKKKFPRHEETTDPGIELTMNSRESRIVPGVGNNRYE